MAAASLMFEEENTVTLLHFLTAQLAAEEVNYQRPPLGPVACPMVRLTLQRRRLQERVVCSGEHPASLLFGAF